MNIYMLYFITGEVFAHHMSAICLSCAFIHCRSVQVLIYLACHPSWEVRKVAYDATKKVLSSSSGLAEDTLFLFTDWLSLVGERLSMLKQGYAPVDLLISNDYLFLILCLPLGVICFLMC